MRFAASPPLSNVAHSNASATLSSATTEPQSTLSIAIALRNHTCTALFASPATSPSPIILAATPKKLASALLLARFVGLGCANVQRPLAFARPVHHAASLSQQQPPPRHPFADHMEPSLNVFGQPLEECGRQPITGFFRDGFCNTAPGDFGSHTVAAVVSDKWLDFSASRGNDLRGILTGGCRWCLCASRWKESFDAFKRGEIDRESVPKVVLAATHQKALDKITLNDLRGFSADRSSSSSDPAQGGPIR